MTADFVQHSTEIDQAAYLVVWTTKTRVSDTGAHPHEPPEIQSKVINSYLQRIARLFFIRNFHNKFLRLQFRDAIGVRLDRIATRFRSLVRVSVRLRSLKYLRCAAIRSPVVWQPNATSNAIAT